MHARLNVRCDFQFYLSAINEKFAEAGDMPSLAKSSGMVMFAQLSDEL